MSVFSAVKSGVTGDLKAISRILPVRRRGENLAVEDNYGQIDWNFRQRFTGLYVNEEVAMTLTAVYRAVSIIASTIAALPLHIYRANQFGEQEQEESPTTAFLWNRPNPEMTRLTFWETLISHEVLNGNAYMFVVKNANNTPLELWPLEPWRVEVGRHNGRKVYQVDGKTALIDFKDGGEIVHVLNLSRNGLLGLSPIRQASVGIELAKAAEEYGARFFGQDSTPTGVLSTDKELTPDQAKNTADLWMRQHSGLDNRNVAVIGNGLKFQAISINPEDAQLLEERRFQVAEIARLFGVPPHLLGDMEKSTTWGSGLEEQGINFLRYTLLRHIEAFEQAIDDALLNRVSTRRKAKFVVDGLQRASFQTRMQGYATAHGRILTANEIRKLEGYPPIEGGDVLLQMTNLAPAPAIEDMATTNQEESQPVGA